MGVWAPDKPIGDFTLLLAIKKVAPFSPFLGVSFLLTPSSWQYWSKPLDAKLVFQLRLAGHLYKAPSQYFSPWRNIRATLEHMIWSVWTAISPRVNATEDQKVFRILAHVVDPPEFVSERGDEYSVIYWNRRFNPLRSNDEALSTIPEILEKLGITVTSALPAEEETSTHTKFEAASDRFTQTGGSESSRDLLRRMKEKGRKKRECWGAWWSSEIEIWSVLCWEICLHSIIWVDRQLILMSIIILMNAVDNHTTTILQSLLCSRG